MSKFIPNSFQIPNVIVDEYIDKLHANSFKLLIFIIRKTKGWQKEKDAISATQLANALNVKTIRKVYPYIKELEQFNLIKIYKSTGKINQYALGENFAKPVTKKSSTQKGTSALKEHIPVPEKNTSTSTLKVHTTKDTIKTTNIKTSSKRFIEPTIDEVRVYCIERGNGINADAFVNHYQANGWMRGKNKIKDWKACVRTWEVAQRNRNKSSHVNAATLAAQGIDIDTGRVFTTGLEQIEGLLN